ncbi:hypothetical protein [Bradyrhizobium sp. 188]|uniref:hypothetical protein n=1 Tax=Bradyrhizobium sp. 188 TaxID=2782656 RepID=UPI001FF8E91A|nr:hypothetical protein [Bradyrhizobium sp. 188]MCK1496078.1 hypothetical protein [Bradyrhizobium sp. 188]
MSRNEHSFTQGAVTKAVKAVVKAGMKVGRVEIAPDRIIVFAGEPEAATPLTNELDRELAEFEARHGQD